jgi:hypothetical protein
MKKSIIAIATLTAAFLSQPAAADAGSNCHFHGNKPAAESTVTSCAAIRKEALIKAGKLDATWQAIKHDKVQSVDGKKGKEWKVTFKDPAAKDKSKETLYMFFTQPGNFIAANFTGQ